MRRGHCHRHGDGQPCTCSMGNLYRFVEPLALYLLKKRGQTHGYDLMGALKEQALTDSTIEPGALYRTLRRLEEAGFVSSTWDVGGSGPARRVYELTADGEAHLREWITVLDHLAGSIKGFVIEARELIKE
ncbi:MAG: PadR family transcriptional regulator [Armatimonadota bacterium]|jgi:PadR family transcriptional regulator PadR